MGTRFVAIGFPLGGAMTMNVGSITHVHQTARVGAGIETYHLRNMLGSGAAIAEGDSGGPWVDLSTQLTYAPGNRLVRARAGIDPGK